MLSLEAGAAGKRAILSVIKASSTNSATPSRLILFAPLRGVTNYRAAKVVSSAPQNSMVEATWYHSKTTRCYCVLQGIGSYLYP